MAALTAIALGLGAASIGAGIYEKTKGDSQSNQAYYNMQIGQAVAAQGAAMQHNISVNQANASVGFAQQNALLNSTANDYSLEAATKSQAINNQIIGLNQQVQAQHQQAMELDAQRQQIENIRQTQRARSQALAVGVAQGGQGYTRGSSALGGAMGQISGQSTTNALNIGQNLQIGENVFGLNNQISNQNINMQQLQTDYAFQRADVQTQMSDLLYKNAVSNAGFQTQQADAQQVISQGIGYTSAAQGMLGQGQQQSNLGSQLISAGPSIFNAGMNLSNMAPTLTNYMGPGFGSQDYTGLFTSRSGWGIGV